MHEMRGSHVAATFACIRMLWLDDRAEGGPADSVSKVVILISELVLGSFTYGRVPYLTCCSFIEFIH